MDGTPLNEMTVHDRAMLLCVTNTGNAVHLAESISDGRAAVPDAWLDPRRLGYTASIERYDQQALRARRWRPLTLCGVGWVSMADTDAGALHGEHDPQHTPTCRRCLTRLDGAFAPIPPDERIGLVAELAAQAVERHGSVQILGVPGPQAAPLRRAIKRELRRRLGPGGHTWSVDDNVVATHDRSSASQDVLDYQHHVVQGLYDESRSLHDRGWHIRWETWARP